MPKPLKIHLPPKKKKAGWSYGLAALGVAALAVLGGLLPSSRRQTTTALTSPEMDTAFMGEDPCAAFDLYPVPHVSASVETIKADDKILIFGENHAYSPYTLACVDKLSTTVFHDKKIAFLLEGREKLKPVTKKVEFMKSDLPMNEESLCTRSPERFSCFGWDEPSHMKKLEKLIVAGSSDFAAEAYFSMKSRNVALVESILKLYLEGDFDVILAFAGSDHLVFEKEPYLSLYKSDQERGVKMMIPELFQKAVDKGYISEAELTQKMKLFKMPSSDHIQTELGKRQVRFPYGIPTTDLSIPCSSDGPEGKRRKLKRICA